MKKKIITLLVILGITGISTVVYFTALNTNTEAARPTLYWGTSGSNVRLVQWKLQQWGYYEGRIDGYFGPETSEAVREFQRKNGLRVDGLVGPQTWAALGYEARPTTYARQTAAAVSRNDDVQLLARLVHAEARGEPYRGQVAIAAVVLNRVESPSFPNSLSGVIYQPLAFESVANGQINLPPTQENLRAARAALNGWDPTYGCLFFWNPSKPVSRWIWSRRVVTTIGSHVFAQ
nr:spore cortex-lytic enzyme [Halothermothrix orenii]